MVSIATWEACTTQGRTIKPLSLYRYTDDRVCVVTNVLDYIKRTQAE